jgi:glycosyltransferase involved in cell wall biosynthesis
VTETGNHLDILFLTHNYPRHYTDFAGRFIARFATLVSERDRRVGVLAPHHPGAVFEEETDCVRVWRFRYAQDAAETLAYRGDWGGVSLLGQHGLWAHRRFFRAFDRRTRELIERYDPEVIHAHWWIPAGWIARRRARGRRLIVTLHGTDLRLLQRQRWLRPMAARVFARAHVITTVSSWLAEFLRATFPAAAGKVQIAPMPPEDGIFTTAGSKLTGNDPPLILCVTRFTTQKRNGTLIKALGILRDRGVHFCCRLVGEGGALRDEVKRQIAELGLAHCVELVGSMPQSDLANEYRQADLTVLPAVDEGFGMALVEAQLCGCAVVGARSGGLTDIITDGDTGLLARPDDPVDLADTMARLLGDSALREELAQRGAVVARQRFSSSAIVDRFLSWYEP